MKEMKRRKGKKRKKGTQKIQRLNIHKGKIYFRRTHDDRQ